MLKLAGLPPNKTWVASLKLAPCTTMVEPGPLRGGTISVIRGETRKFPALGTLLFSVILPVFASGGTMASIGVKDKTTKPAGDPLKAMRDASFKLLPVMRIFAPGCPIVGEKEVRPGAAGTASAMTKRPSQPP